VGAGLQRRKQSYDVRCVPSLDLASGLYWSLADCAGSASMGPSEEEDNDRQPASAEARDPRQDHSRGVSANLLYGFAPFILQNTSRGGGIRPRGSAEHLVGLEEQRRGNGQAKLLRGLEVDDQLACGGLLHR
jgi:hypothetical protein